MSKPTDIRVIGTRLYFIPIQTRLPLKFGTETVTSVTCARACVRVADRQGRTVEGWGETPLSVQWVWPSKTPYEIRHQVLKSFCARLAEAWVKFGEFGHAIEIGYDFQERELPRILEAVNQAMEGNAPAVPISTGRRQGMEGNASSFPTSTGPRQSGALQGNAMPWLAALVCCSVFDQAIHDGYGNLLQRPVYETYGPEFMNRNLY